MKNSILIALTRLCRAVLLFLLLTAGIYGTSTAQTQFMGWAGTFQNIRFSRDFGLWFDGQLRSTDQWRETQALLLRPGLNWYITKSLTATAGWAYIHQRRTVGHTHGYLAEHRSWQQLLLTHRVHKATVSHRLRLEQRHLPRPLVQDNSLVADGYTQASRLRYFTRGLIPVGGMDKPGAFSRGYFAAFQNEVFFNMGDATAANGKIFDQNRAYLAVGYRHSKQFDIELGYMNQYISTANGGSLNNHILQCATYLRL
jgi:hypothetical protein